MTEETPICYNVIAATDECTVVSEYKRKSVREESYQTEAQLEAAFIKQLTEQGYEYLNIHSSDHLIKNLRAQLEKLNNYTFSDDEWQRFFSQNIAKQNDGIKEKTRIIQEDNVQVLIRDDGSSKNITLIDKVNIHHNFLQVINQYEANDGTYKNRYDVTILVNGFPLVHCELKRRGVFIKEAFNQINRYQRDSFWSNAGLFEYVQIFVISNGTDTKYYSNTTRFNAQKEHATGKQSGKRTSNSFEFTSFWADAKNKIIPDLEDFTKTFFARHTLLNILTKYCVFTSEQQLLVMRPYQIVATERIINRIEIANNYKKYGTIDGGGYIWHTTGSGKTLTSFKTAQIASKLPYIDKVLFVVDRKDLDYQTMKEYDRFEKGAANGNRSTKILKRQIENVDEKGNFHDYRILVTTIQKLNQFITDNKTHEIYNKHVVLIFDECHRSQFGDMHQAVTKHFKKYHLFGFTGTPIFAVNAKNSGNPKLRTTQQAFGDQLHRYTIVNAISDRNVLPFLIAYINTMKTKDGDRDKQVEAINTEAALLAPERISNVTDYILDNFDQKTKRNSGMFYNFNKLQNIVEVAKDGYLDEIKTKQRLNGFNSIFAVSSIPAAKAYYSEFLKKLEERHDTEFKVATIYSFAANEDDDNGFMGEESSEDTEGLDTDSRSFLEKAISNYNKMFGTAYDTSAEKFQNYYKDVSLRMKNREIDLLIVVNMFLTGFDATTLNTLWVDKNLKQHGLIQAFSRTNRILNSIKTYGNIVCFRDLEEETNKAISLFGDENAGGIVLVKSYKDYYDGYDDSDGKHHMGYSELVTELLEKYPLDERIISESIEKDFIKAFGGILRLRNILTAFDEFAGNEILTPRDFQDYTGRYYDLYDKYRKSREKDDIRDEIVFEMELVKQIAVNIDYILMLVAKYHASNCEDKEILDSIDKAIKSSLELRSKKELIDKFIDRISTVKDVQNDWRSFVKVEQKMDLDELISSENLNAEETKKFVTNAFRDGAIQTTGRDIDKIMPPISRFGKSGRAQKKEGIIAKLKKFFEKYFGLGMPEFD